MLRQGLLTLLLWTLPLTAVAADLTQREWMEQLVAGLGWEYGLPDEPQDEDYIRLLTGARTVRLEVETDHRKSELVAVKRYTNYGEYSGTGWVSGFRRPTQIHLDFLLRHAGSYRLAVASRKPGVLIELAGREFRVDGGETFARHELDILTLPAGQTELVITLPANAAIDYVELSAPALMQIAPLGGWQPEQPIKTADLALTGLQLLDLLSLLPPTQLKHQFELELYPSPPGLVRSTERHLGVPSGYAWLRTGNQVAEFEAPIKVPAAACYQLFLRASGEESASVRLGDFLARQVRFGHSLTNQLLGSYCLPQQTLNLQIQLPPWAGIDLFELTQSDTSPAAVAGLLGLSAEQQVLDQQVINQLLELFSGMVN